MLPGGMPASATSAGMSAMRSSNEPAMLSMKPSRPGEARAVAENRASLHGETVPSLAHLERVDLDHPRGAPRLEVHVADPPARDGDAPPRQRCAPLGPGERAAARDPAPERTFERRQREDRRHLLEPRDVDGGAAGERGLAPALVVARQGQGEPVQGGLPGAGGETRPARNGTSPSRASLRGGGGAPVSSRRRCRRWRRRGRGRTARPRGRRRTIRRPPRGAGANDRRRAAGRGARRPATGSRWPRCARRRSSRARSPAPRRPRSSVGRGRARRSGRLPIPGRARPPASRCPPAPSFAEPLVVSRPRSAPSAGFTRSTSGRRSIPRASQRRSLPVARRLRPKLAVPCQSFRAACNCNSPGCSPKARLPASTKGPPSSVAAVIVSFSGTRLASTPSETLPSRSAGCRSEKRRAWIRTLCPSVPTAREASPCSPSASIRYPSPWIVSSES